MTRVLNNLPVLWKIGLVFGLSMLVLVSTTGISGWTMIDARGGVAQLTDRTIAELDWIARFKQRLTSAHLHLYERVTLEGSSAPMDRREASMDALNSDIAAVHDLIGEGEAMFADQADILADLEEIRETLSHYEEFKANVVQMVENWRE